jgi:hypothetical protein
MWGPSVIPFPISFSLSALSPVTHNVGAEELAPAPPWPPPTVLAHSDACRVAAGTDAEDPRRPYGAPNPRSAALQIPITSQSSLFRRRPLGNCSPVQIRRLHQKSGE